MSVGWERDNVYGLDLEALHPVALNEEELPRDTWKEMVVKWEETRIGKKGAMFNYVKMSLFCIREWGLVIIGLVDLVVYGVWVLLIMAVSIISGE